jgi:hypothetical protein
MANSNTREALIKTPFSDDAPYIACPKCGTLATLRRPGSVRPVLADKTRDSLNRHLRSYRQYVISIATTLNQINDGVEGRNPIIDRTIDVDRLTPHLEQFQAKEHTRSIQAEGRQQGGHFALVDDIIWCLSNGDVQALIMAHIKKLHTLLSSSDSTGSEAPPSPDICAIIEYLLLPIEKSDLFAATTAITLDEPRVALWVQKIRAEARIKHCRAANAPNDDSPQQQDEGGAQDVSIVHVIDQLGKLCPTGAGYLMKYLSLLAHWIEDKSHFDTSIYAELSTRDLSLKTAPSTATATATAPTDGDERMQPEDLRSALLNRCERAAFLVTLMLMHMTAGGRDAIIKNFSPQGRLPTGNGEYRLPEITAITFDSLRRLMQSTEVYFHDILDIRMEYSEVLQSIAEITRASDETAHGWFIRVIRDTNIGQLLSRIFGFGCQGPPAQMLSFKETTISDGSTDFGIKDICGWIPKDEQTYSILLIGSPGCGKSYAFLSGMKTLPAALSQKSGFTYQFSANSDMLMDRLRSAFNARKTPSRTEISSYHCIEFTLWPAQSHGKRLHFVVSDIAGEQATQRLREGDSSPLVGQTLRSADIIVAFFDPSIDPDFASRIETGPQAGKLQRLIQCRRNARKDRPDEISAGLGGSESVADVSQLAFIDSILTVCKSERPAGDKAHLILVVPKIDLYADLEQTVYDSGSSGSETEPYIMQRVFTDACQSGLIYPQKTPSASEDNKLKWMTSSGVEYAPAATGSTPQDNQPAETTSGGAGVAATPSPLCGTLAGAVERYVNGVVQQLDALSQSCETGLLNLGRLVDGDPELGREAKNWNNQMQALIEGLRSEFASVHLLPVSAQGKSDMDSEQLTGRDDEPNSEADDSDQTPDEDLQYPTGEDDQSTAQAHHRHPRSANTPSRIAPIEGHPQKFSEFMILGPAMLMVKKQWLPKPTPQPSPDPTPQPSPDPTPQPHQIRRRSPHQIR